LMMQKRKKSLKSHNRECKKNALRNRRAFYLKGVDQLVNIPENLSS